jgi:hypothetical protein
LLAQDAAAVSLTSSDIGTATPNAVTGEPGGDVPWLGVGATVWYG